MEVPAVGGPVDSRSPTVPLDDGQPPEVIDQNWLWVEYGGEVLDADMAGVYELESFAGGKSPVYSGCRRVTVGSEVSLRRRLIAYGDGRAIHGHRYDGAQPALLRRRLRARDRVDV
ncbi:hypothetical protein ACFP2T_36135 [Plantactinospora solaniradicis]|uniref:Uncharacterized protein n=1 Tax=Plantactinospora solaniradicis TaxID=1723736 RepID=A0ABW1KJZ0_9ACTN